MNGKPETKNIYFVKINHGYREQTMAFETLQEASDLFGILVSKSVKPLVGVEGINDDGEEKKAMFMGNPYKISLETRQVELYPDEKTARFAVNKAKGDLKDIDE